MTFEVQSNLMELLAGFKTTGGIEATLVTSRSGVHLTSLVPARSNPDILAAMSSALHSAADIISSQVNQGTPNRVVTECEHCKLIMTKAGEKALFIVLQSGNANLGPLFIKMDTTASKIEELLEDFHQ
ncbi:MAG: roadblock/LC7 domain-containing protein [Methanosarcinales archaeon]|nr:roadblock/LC7 domain-containing protein [Methanosarcinales archaeon]